MARNTSFFQISLAIIYYFYNHKIQEVLFFKNGQKLQAEKVTLPQPAQQVEGRYRKQHGVVRGNRCRGNSKNLGVNHNSTIYYTCGSQQAFNLSETQFQMEKIMPILYWAAGRIQLNCKLPSL